MKRHKTLLLIALLAAQMARAATLTVTTTADSGPGSLRDALATAADGDTINFSVTGSILLTSGELLVTKSVSILGPGSGNLEVVANFATRVLHVMPSNAVSIADVAITRGRADAGGGIYNDRATLTLSNCRVSWNNASLVGGGIWNDGLGSDLKLVNTTVSDNSAGTGGGISNTRGGTVTLANSTVSGNSAFYRAGGILHDVGNMRIVNSTLSRNSGQYVSSIDNHGHLEIGSSILAEWVGGGTIYIYGRPVTSLGYNLSSDGGGGFLNATGDQINTDPWLGPLQDNGGPTFTHALLGCSPAIDRGYNFSASSTDQRGFSRTFDDATTANASGGDGTDVGAFEAQAHVPPQISCPDDIVANATSPAGAVVSFVPTPSDNCEVASITCTPSSGSTFTIGTTTVTCQATYDFGLMSSCSFAIYVKGAAEQISDVIAFVQFAPIDGGLKNGLLAKLQDALNGVNANNKPKVCSALQDFINLCNAQLAKRKLDADTANYLIGEATRIRAVIGC